MKETDFQELQNTMCRYYWNWWGMKSWSKSQTHFVFHSCDVIFIIIVNRICLNVGNESETYIWKLQYLILFKNKVNYKLRIIYVRE